MNLNSQNNTNYQTYIGQHYNMSDTNDLLSINSFSQEQQINTNYNSFNEQLKQSQNNIEDLSKVSEDKHATPVFEFLVKMQQDAQKKYIYEKNTSKKTREDSSQRKPTLKSTRN